MGLNPSITPDDEVRIDVPFLCGAKPRRSYVRAAKTAFFLIISWAFVLSYFFVSYYYPWENNSPGFQLDYVSASFDHNNTTVVWDIGYSINASVGDHLQVWTRFMSRDYKAEAGLGRKGNSSVSISTLLPRGTNYTDHHHHDHFPLTLTLERVVFKCKDYKDGNHNQSLLMAACEDVGSWNETSIETANILKGDPRLCPIVYNNPIYVP